MRKGRDNTLNFQLWTIILGVLNIIYIILYFIENSKIKNAKEENAELNKNKIKNSPITKKWERITTNCIVILFISLYVFSIIINKKFSSIYYYCYNITLFLLPISILVNVLSNKRGTTSNEKLLFLVNTPGIFYILSTTPIINKLKSMISINNILYYIFSQTAKNFLILFFLILDITLILLKLKTILQISSTKKQKKDRYKNIYPYIFANARNKKGIVFLINYLKDILIFIKLLFISIIKYYYSYTIKQPIILIKTLLIKLTNNFSINVIIIKNFNIALIISLLITHYNLLNLYKENAITDFYGVIITTIIIPSILNIFTDRKEK